MDIRTIGGRIQTELDDFLQADYEYWGDNKKLQIFPYCDTRRYHKEQYQKWEALLNNWNEDNDKYELYAWCDISGYEYWKEEEESNYWVVTLRLKDDNVKINIEDVNYITDRIYELWSKIEELDDLYE